MVLRDTDDRAGVVPDSRGRTDWLLGWVRVAGEHHRVATHQRARRGVAGDSHRLRGRLVCARPHGDDVPRFFLFEQESSAWVLPPRASRPCRARHRCAQDHRTGRSSRPKTIEGSRCGGVWHSRQLDLLAPYIPPVAWGHHGELTRACSRLLPRSAASRSIPASFTSRTVGRSQA